MMEIGGSFAGLFQQTLYAASIHLTDVCRCLNRTAVSEAFDDAHPASLVSCISEPCRSLKRVPQVLQYSRRMALSLPICSATERLPELKRLKSAQSPFGQAKNERGRPVGSSLLWAVFCLGIQALFAENGHLSDNISAKPPRTAQFCCYPLPIS